MNQDLLNDIKREIIYSDEESVEEYYGVQINVYKDIDKYLSKIPDIYDKIHIAQYANNYKKANELISSLQLDDETKAKYSSLLQNNADLNETIDIRVLLPKYSFLNDMIDMIVTNKDVQEQLLSLSDEKLELFKLMYQRISENVDYRVPYVTALLNRMGTMTPYTSWKNTYYRYEQLEGSIIESIKDGRELSVEEIDNLLYLYTTNVIWNVRGIEELRNFTKENGIFQISIDNIIQNEQKQEKKDINRIKNALLLKTYGIDLISAEALCKRYNIKGIKINQDNIDLFEMYKAMLEIIGENDANVLIDVYNQFSNQTEVSPNFMRVITFENAMRKIFAQNLNMSVFKCGDNYTLEGDVKIFDAGTDFKMIVTAIGAYQSNFEDKDNYKEYWNSPTIRSHGNCCSLIGNNNLSMANPKNVIFGFSTMDDNMLLLSSSRDINSTPSSRQFNIATEQGLGTNYTIDGKEYSSIGRMGLGIEFSNPDNLLDNTRGDYNELVYERRDLSSNPTFYKKNPDYIVYIEEYENIDEYFEQYKDNNEMLIYLNEQKEQQKYQLEQSLKAAKDFDIPIVKINRERCAKQAITEIEQSISDFENSLDPDLIKKIICQFENNRVGNHDKHVIIRDKYLSVAQMNSYLSKIEQVISNIEDRNLRNMLLNEYNRAIVGEQKKVESCKRFRKNGQTSGFDFETTLNRIKAITDVQPDIEK